MKTVDSAVPQAEDQDVNSCKGKKRALPQAPFPVSDSGVGCLPLPRPFWEHDVWTVYIHIYINVLMYVDVVFPSHMFFFLLLVFTYCPRTLSMMSLFYHWVCLSLTWLVWRESLDIFISMWGIHVASVVKTVLWCWVCSSYISQRMRLQCSAQRDFCCGKIVLFICEFKNLSL